MSDTTTLDVSLTPELQEFVASRVASGRYPSASEVVLAALRLLEEHERTREAALDEVRRKIASGLAQAKRGELRDGEEVFEELERRGQIVRILHGARDVGTILDEEE